MRVAHSRAAEDHKIAVFQGESKGERANQQSLPTDVAQSIDSFLAAGQFQTSDEVLRAAVGLLEQQEADCIAIQEGVADEEAGRLSAVAEVLGRLEAIHAL